MSLLYPSVSKLPGIVKDKYGNLNVRGVGQQSGLRHRYPFILRLSFQALAGVCLADILNWMRWGSPTGVMWECTIEELFRLIVWWERANPNAPRSLYGIDENRELPKWKEFWERPHTYALVSGSIKRCPCGKIFPHQFISNCSRCGTLYWKAKTENLGPRGLGSYNLAIHAADGLAVAALAYATRDKPRPIPKNLTVSPSGIF